MAEMDRFDLLLVPGLLCTDALFAPQVEGLGDVARIRIGQHTRHDSMEEIAAFILETAPDRFVLGGLSMGGYVAFEVLRQAPARVQGLILMDTSARADREQQREDRGRLIEVAQAKGIDPVMDTVLPMLIHPDRMADQALTQVVRTMARETGVEAFARQQTAIMGRPDNRPFLEEISCPVLVIVGAKDQLTPVKVAQEMVEGLGNARLAVIPDCGHLATLERPDAVNDHIRSFLAALRR